MSDDKYELKATVRDKEYTPNSKAWYIKENLIEERKDSLRYL